MKSETSNNRINYKNEFIFGMIWGNGTQPRQLSVYKKDDVLLAVNKAYRDMIQHNMKGFGLKKVYELKCKTDKEKAKKRKDILSRKNEIVKELKEELAIKIIEIFKLFSKNLCIVNKFSSVNTSGISSPNISRINISHRCIGI